MPEMPQGSGGVERDAARTASVVLPKAPSFLRFKTAAGSLSAAESGQEAFADAQPAFSFF
jgi:hypothetical protein